MRGRARKNIYLRFFFFFNGFNTRRAWRTKDAITESAAADLRSELFLLLLLLLYIIISRDDRRLKRLLVFIQTCG